MRLFYTVIAFFLCGLVSAQDDWKLAKDSKGIKIYTKNREGFSVKEYKAITRINSTREELLKTILNGDSLQYWTYKTDDSKLLKKESDSLYYVYMYNDFPWPVKNRDHISKLIVSYPSENSTMVSIESSPKYIPNKKGVVRVVDFSGFWLFENQDEGVLVTQQLYGDPAGYLPNFIVNSMLVKGPYNTFLKLKERLRK